MKALIHTAIVFFLILSPALGLGQEWKPTILVYSSDMPGFAQAIAEKLAEHFEGDFEFVVVGDQSQLSSLIPLPDTACVVLPVMKGKEVDTLIKPLITYFEKGGAAIGFQGCLGQSTVDDLAREVFPAFANATGSFSTKAGIPVNEYVRDSTLEGFEDLPEQFDLLGQFFMFSAGADKKVLEPQPKGGELTVLYRDKKSGAPLIIAYESEGGSRSVGYAGFFVRSVETARNYYGKLLDDPLFIDLLVDSLAWTLQGSTLSSRYESSYKQLIQDEKDRIRALSEEAAKAESIRERNKMIYLGLSWALGLAAVVGLVYHGFIRSGGTGT